MRWIYLSLMLSVAISFSTTASALADHNCVCGTIVHVDYPTTCPHCQRPLPNTPPPFTPPPYTPPFTPPVTDGSGVELGVMIYTAGGGRVVVQSVKPNTPAAGNLFPNDQLVKGAFRDAATNQVFKIPIRSQNDLTRLKTLAGGGTDVAMQVYRPTTGTYRNFMLRFAVQGGSAARAEAFTVRTGPGGRSSTVARPRAARTTTFTEDTTGAAAALLGGPANAGRRPGGPPVVNPGTGPRPGGPPVVNPGTPSSGGDTADSLLNGQ